VKIRNEFAHDLEIDSFSKLIASLINGLKNLRVGENLAYLRSTIQKVEFITTLFEESMVENKSRLQAVMAEEPISVEIRDGNRIESYAGGLVNISADQGNSLIRRSKKISRICWA
jgi:hypothetical protein